MWGSRKAGGGKTDFERNSTSSAPERKVEDVNLGLQRFSLPAPQHCWHRSIPQVN